MAVQTVIGSGNFKNNGGTVVYGGAANTAGAITNVPDLSIVASRFVKTNGNGPVITTNVIQKADTNGSFGVMTAGSYVIRGVTDTLAGVSKTALLSGGSCPISGYRPINWKTNRRTYHITSWNYVTGAATKGAATNDDFGADHAATPTRAIPGELTITDHGLANTGALSVPLNTDYEAKTG